MSRIEQISYEKADPAARAAYEAHEHNHGQMTNMKRTLLHSLPAFYALMEWYTLRDVVLPFLGERATALFAHAISAETDCLICTTFFRRLLIDAGENPDELTLDERETVLVAFGRHLVQERSRVPDALYAQLSGYFAPAEIVSLTAFGGLMIATNVFNNALEVDLDGYLEPYRRQSTVPAAV